MKKIVCEVDEDYLNELCEAFKQKPLGGIPTHIAWALLEGLKNGIVLDGLANGEVMQKMFPQMEIISASSYSIYIEMKECNQFNNIVSFDVEWWNRKWGE